MVVSVRMDGFGGKAREAGVGARQILSPRLLFPTTSKINDFHRKINEVGNKSLGDNIWRAATPALLALPPKPPIRAETAIW